MKIPKNGRPQGKNIRELSEEHKASLHRIDKKSVSMKAADTTGETLGGTFAPTDDDLTKINAFTRRTVGSADVVAFHTMSCNDLFDRDDERFTTDCVKGFAALKPPFSFTGKSFMSDHTYAMGSVRGRIFDTDTENVDGTEFLKNSVYVPNTAQYADYIENLDFGLAWAVSVGVVVDSATCTICDAHVYTSRFFGSWCDNGHDKGYYYVPGEEEDDGWGFFIPVDPSTKGAVKAQVNLDDPIDGYEISQVFLGAQYYAELAKKPGFSGILKAASARTVPIVGLSRKEAESLPIPEEPEEVSAARAQYSVTINENGDPTWTDDTGLVWVYTSNNDKQEVMCLGRSADDASEIDGEELRPDGQEGAQDDGDEDHLEDARGGSGDAPERTEGADGSVVGGPGQVDSAEEANVDKTAVLAAIRAAGLPDSIRAAVEAASDDGLSTLLSEMSLELKTLRPKAALGEEYMKQLRSDALAWYVKAHQTEGAPVSTENFSKMLDRIGDDVDLYQDIIEEQKGLARAKFPSSTRRSSFETNPNEAADLVEVPTSKETKRTTTRIHRS